jgi:glycosyltransferase involved in cell wall biosynthesis
MAQLDQENEYVLFSGPETPPELPSQANFRSVRLSSSFVPYYEQRLLPQALVRENVDVVWCPANTGPIRSRTPVVLSLHDVIFRKRGSEIPKSSSRYQRLGAIYTDWSASRLAPKAKVIVTSSEFSRREIVELMGVQDSRISIIFHGLSVKPGVASVDVGDLLGEELPFFFCLGATDPRKNTLFTAQTFVRSPLTETHMLVIAGLSKADQTSISEAISSEALRHRVKLLGFIPDAQLQTLYVQCVAFIFPSLYEGFGLPVLEAMGIGAPLISSNRTSMPEVGGDAILYFDPSSQAELVQQMVLVANDPEKRRALREAGFEQAKKFSWDTSAKQIIEVLLKAGS